MSKTFVLGDLHGANKALQQVLERSGFDKEFDTLIQLGDVADGWSEVYECVEELLSIKNLIPIKGNHDDWFSTWLKSGVHPTEWEQGAHATATSYANHANREIVVQKKLHGCLTNLSNIDIPLTHNAFFQNQINYYKDESQNIFIHGGFNRHFLLRGQPEYIYYWDRDLWLQALSVKAGIGFEEQPKVTLQIKEPHKEIFIGHTTTMNWKTDKPMRADVIWNLDTGAGFKGRLTIMDVATHEYWQSDPCNELYPNEIGR